MHHLNNEDAQMAYEFMEDEFLCESCGTQNSCMEQPSHPELADAVITVGPFSIGDDLDFHAVVIWCGACFKEISIFPVDDEI